MHYWWVNQNQTYEQEIQGGYMWSPKRSGLSEERPEGIYNQYYENMREVAPGDLVFSFRTQSISNIGIVQSHAISSPKPAEFGSRGEYWANNGWLVPVQWHPIANSIRPKDLISELRPTLPDKYSPLHRETGKGLQSVYLAAVPDEMAEILLRHIGSEATAIQARADNTAVEGESIIEAIEEEVQAAIVNDTTIDSTIRTALVNARKGQGRYRQNLEEIERCCRVTGVNDKRLLRASHIKPWRSCESNEERLDGYNGLLLTPHVDLLFDRGFISFADDGQLLVSSGIDVGQVKRMGIDTDGNVNVGNFTREQLIYLAYHRQNVFIG